MAQQWPRTERLDAGALVAAVHAHGGPRLRLVRSLPGGQVGAAVVELTSGQVAVLSGWPGAVGRRSGTARQVVRRLRSRGYPAPAYLHVVPCGPVTAVLAEYVDGRPPVEVGTGLVRSLLELNRLQRGVMRRAGGSVADLHLDRDGPGYCLHEPMRRHDRRTAALLEEVHDVARAVAPDAVRGSDAVHGDFHPDNVLVAADDPARVLGVVDWTGASVGHCGLDLVTLGFFLDATGGPAAARAAVRERITADVAPDAALAFTAHMALRQVDWMVRHHGAAEVSRWTDVAQDWLAWAAARSG